MGKILSLEPAGIEKRIHPQALEIFKKFRFDFGWLKEVPDTIGWISEGS